MINLENIPEILKVEIILITVMNLIPLLLEVLYGYTTYFIKKVKSNSF